MTRELIDKIKKHAWTKPELDEITEFCVQTAIDGDYITENREDTPPDKQ